jgi:hypothetical protein
VDFFKYILSFPALFVVLQLSAQSGSIRQVEKKMQEGGWSKSRELINKLLDKDTLNMEARLILSKWFLHPENPSYQLDSAYRHTTWALAHFKEVPARQRDKFKKENADSLDFLHLFLKVDSLSFERARNLHTEEAYRHFLRQFPSSANRERAVELRDETAFSQALKINTFAAFADYLQKYPQSLRSKEAASRYERLLYEEKTKSKKLNSYELFAEAFPQSPYREEAIKNIFQISTASGLPADFQHFITKYPGSSYMPRAKSFLYYLTLDHDEGHRVRFELDSMVQLQKLNTETWLPVYKKGKYGFLNDHGEPRMEPAFTSIARDYFCGGVKDEILSTSAGLVKRNGNVIFKPCHEVRDIGLGFLLAKDSVGGYLLHKSGVVLEKNIDDATLLRGRFLVVTKDDLKCLMSLSGRVLIPYESQTIDMMEGIVVVNRYGKKILFKTEQVVAAADGHVLKEEFVFDDVRSVGYRLLLVRNGALEGLVNDRVEFVVPLGRQGLEPTAFGLIRKIEDYFLFSDFNAEVAEQRWQRYKLERQWLLLQNQQETWLADVHTKKVYEKKADSLWLSEGIAFAKIKDSLRVFINSNTIITLPSASAFSFIKSPDSIRYFYSQQRGKKIIYDLKTGEKKLSIEGDQVESIGTQYFLVTRKNKKGLLNTSGKIILPFEYDAMLFKKDVVTLLKEKKFGLYHLPSAKLIKPAFGCNLASIDSAYLVACKNDLYGIIDWEAKPVTLFEFNEIRPWGTHTIWARKNYEWVLMNYVTGKVILSKIKNYHPVHEGGDDQVAIVQQENFFGVVSSARGVLVPPTLTYVTNVGSTEHPLYFTSKEVEEAGIFVVIYYNQAGQLLHKEVYEEEEYEKIVCPED